MESDLERETISRALEGDHEAGREALELCAIGLEGRALSPALADYLAERIRSFLDGQPLERALCVEEERGPGKPRDPIPEWQTELAAFDLLLERRGYAVEKRNDAMDAARTKTSPKGRGIHRSDATTLRKAHLPMRSLDDATLLHLAGESMREILARYLPH
jgi:hypothetical protein